MFGKSKRQIENVTFVQPRKGEVYFYTPIAYATNLRDSKEKEGKQVFTDSDLALAGKLKLIFEREKMTWFKIKEEKSTTPQKEEHFFALYYYPHRLVESRASSSDEKATLQEIKQLFDFIVTEEQIRFAEVQRTKSPSAYAPFTKEPKEESEAEPKEESEAEPEKESEALSAVAAEPSEEPEAIPTEIADEKQ
jgi:chemotaxis protein histidine kinase CheA